MSVDPLWFDVWGDVFSNLAAGWFAAVIVVPITTTRPTHTKLSLLAINTLFGIVAVVIAVYLKRLS